MTANINQLLEISMDEAVLDMATPNPPGEDIQETPEQQKVLCEEDLVGKSASITYNDHLHRLAMYLQLPMQMCNYSNRVTGATCPGKSPFQVTLKPRGTGVALEWVR